MTNNIFFQLVLTAFILFSCTQQNPTQVKAMNDEINMNQEPGLEVATLGAGCFWCVEAIFQDLKGVKSAVSGYSGGHVKNPTYKEVCRETTGHAEVIQVTFDPKVITFKEILEVFWETHDPTTLNQQGNDKGTQYRSAIFYHNDIQKDIAKQSRRDADKSGQWDNPIVTEIKPFKAFYKAENYHQDYYSLNGNQPYCTYVITPKVEKFKKQFKDKLKKQ